MDDGHRVENDTAAAAAGRVGLWRHFLLVSVCLIFFIPGIFTLPPIDRDEARFAQASSQMLETGDYVRINFQDEARNKKPIAIYWLQAASAAIFGGAEPRKIWLYRIPSFLGAVLAVLFTFSMGRRLFGEATGLLGAVLAASSILLTVEAHLATTDAVLLATVVAAQGALSRFYLRESGEEPPGVGVFLTFWTAQAMGILVKGPITPMISLLTVIVLCAADRDAGWLRGMRPLFGLALVAVLVSPWAIAIGIATKGVFFQQALWGDFFSKVSAGRESHGFPPGFYLLLMPLTLWPASALAGVSVFRAWRSRQERAVRFCLAWSIPAWVLFELVPTKLPHYVMPVYPALCLLVAHAIISSEKGSARSLDSKLVRAGYAACQLVIILLGIGALALEWYPGHTIRVSGVLIAVVAVAGGVLSTWKFFRRRYVHAAAVAIITTAAVMAPSLQFVLPNADWLWLSRNVADAARTRTGADVSLCSTGYEEPSLVFLTGTKTLLTNPGGAADFLGKNPKGVALVAAGDDIAFRRAVRDQGLHVRFAGAFYGFNYSKGRNMLLRLYSAAPATGTDDGPAPVSGNPE